MQVNPYLAFNGKCEEALNVYAKVLNGKILFKMTNGESPMADKTPPEHRNRIMHATLQVGDRLIMAADAPPNYYTKPAGFSVSVNCKDIATTVRFYTAISEGCEWKLPLQTPI